MSQIHLMELSEVARLEESRQATALAEITDAHERIAGGVVGRGKPGMWINNAVGLGLSGPVTRADVDRLIAFHEAAGAEPRIELCPFADPSLAQHLGDAGFRIASSGTLGGFESVMFRTLDIAPGAAVEPAYALPEGLEIRRVDPGDDAVLTEYARVVCSGFFPPGETVPDEAVEVSIRCLKHPRTVGMAAWFDGQLVGGGAMEIAGDVAALFGLSVIESFRRRGVQQALIAHRLNMARQRNAKVATIGTRPGISTERNARRMGFQVAYTKAILVRPGPGLLGVIG